MKHPFHVGRAARADAIDHVTIGFLKMLRSFPFVGRVADPFIGAVIPARPREPIAIHLHAEDHDHRLAELARGIAPLVDVAVPFAGENFVQAEFVGPAVLRVGTIPRRPKNERQRAVPPDDIEIPRRETLFAPVTRRSNNRLVFAHHVLEFLDRLERHFIFRVAEIHERAGVGALGRQQDFYRRVGIDS